jgi:hypothetical protein
VPAAQDAGAQAPERTEEEKKAEKETPDAVKSAVVGKEGGVPIHERGEFRSPFANPSWPGGPVTVHVGLLLSRIHDYDIKEGTYDADFNLSLTSARPMPKMDLKVMNGKLDVMSVLADTPTFKLYRVQGKFFSPIDLHDYPFDTQELRIELEDDAAGIDQMRLVAAERNTNLDAGFQVPGWDVVHLEAITLRHYYPDRFDNDDMYYSQYVFKLGIKRFGTSAAFTVFVPAIVIVLISLTGLFMPREELAVRSNSGAPMLAAAVLFHFTLTQSLPAVAYLTRADKVMIAVYASLTLNMLSSWIWFVLAEHHSDRIFRIGRALVPPVTIGVMTAGVLV